MEAAGNVCGWSHGCGGHGGRVKLLFSGPSQFSYARVFLAYTHMRLWTQTLRLGFFGMVTAGGMLFHSVAWRQPLT